MLVALRASDIATFTGSLGSLAGAQYRSFLSLNHNETSIFAPDLQGAITAL